MPQISVYDGTLESDCVLKKIEVNAEDRKFHKLDIDLMKYILHLILVRN